ncbi:MAG: ABC transporter ATP-binding protein [Actinobacteria bacterium]|jgi:branched-chain amino acid transport system ATP-binding protein|nr:ABC transporter ATP-binding protein [Actinomycetota bacterium]
MALLETRGVTVHYGKSLAVEDVSLRVEEGDVVSIIGANGAGKSTLLRALMGLKPVTDGEIFFGDEKIDGMRTNEIVKRGLILVPEGRRLFPYLSVLTNLRLGASLVEDKDEIEKTLKDVYRLFPRLKERRNQKAGTLSGGEQQMVAIGRGLMGKPKLLCMDEPSLGLAPIVVEAVGEAIKDINGKGVTVLLVEQNVHLALEVASSCYALQVGRVVMSGDMDTMRSSDVVKKAYLGG